MICKHCGHENADGLTFCQNCGKRLDGKKVCPACGAKIDEEAKFCGVCGANMEIINSETAVAQAAVVNQSKTFDKESAKKIIDLTGTILVCFAAFIGLLFTFFIGIKTTGGSSTMTNTVYNYFREAYDGLSDATYHNDYQRIIAYMPNVAGTVVSVAAILGTVILAVLTTVSAVKQFTNNQKNTKLATLATTTYVWYAVSSILFLAIHAMSMNLYGTVTEVSFSATTLAGLILGGIALCGHYCCRIISNLQEYKNKKIITLSLFALISAVLTAIVMVLSALPVVMLEYPDTATTKISTGYFSLSTLSILLSDSVTAVYKTGDPTIVASCLDGFVSQAIMIILAAIAFIMLANAVCGKDNAKILPVFTAGSFAVSISNLICAIVAAKKFEEIIPKASLYSYAVPLAILVLSALAFAGSIVYSVLYSKCKKEEGQS